VIRQARPPRYASLVAHAICRREGLAGHLKARARPSIHLHGKLAGLDCERGQATVEMVVSLMVVMSLVFWLFEFCMFIYTCSVLNDATEEGVRYAIVHGTDSTLCSGPDSACTNHAPYSNVQAAVKATASASLHNMSAMTVSVSYANNTAAVGNPVAVTVSYTYVPYVQRAGLGGKVSFSSQGEIVY
jgi:Flp pilus assembly protein TadG